MGGGVQESSGIILFQLRCLVVFVVFKAQPCIVYQLCMAMSYFKTLESSLLFSFFARVYRFS